METYTVGIDSPEYPEEARRMHRPPPELYCQGDLAGCLAGPRVAIVGTRAVSAYGRQVTAQLVRQLAQQGVTIISGLALGVDAVAHQACLDAGGKTIAVLPTPVETPGPPSNEQLARRILERGGALISQYPIGQPSSRYNFVARNELVAALSQAVIVTEAAQGSGTRHTATFAQQLGVPIFAVPGNITSPQSAGSNAMLKSQLAAPLTDWRDLCDILPIGRQQRTLALAGTPTERTLLQLIADGTHDTEALLSKSGLSFGAFSQSLTGLELDGRIKPIGGGQWIVT